MPSTQTHTASTRTRLERGSDYDTVFMISKCIDRCGVPIPALPLALCLWANYSTSLSSSFLISNVELILLQRIKWKSWLCHAQPTISNQKVPILLLLKSQCEHYMDPKTPRADSHLWFYLKHYKQEQNESFWSRFPWFSSRLAGLHQSCWEEKHKSTVCSGDPGPTGHKSFAIEPRNPALLTEHAWPLSRTLFGSYTGSLTQA